jgi:hypothetical protein
MSHIAAPRGALCAEFAVAARGLACYPGKQGTRASGGGRAIRNGEVVPTKQQDLERSSSRRTRLLSTGFNLRRHVAAFGALAASGLGVAAWLLRRARLADLWIVPVYLVVANLVEYGVHRVLMHRPLWPRALYRGHTLGHHRAFHHDSMAIASWRELELVMMPWLSILIFFVVLGPIVAAVAWAFGRGAAGFFLLTGASSFLLYEGMHALYHLPPAVLARLGLGRSRLFQLLYRHHQHHHRLSRMRWVNFNISCPLGDRLFGTLEDEKDWQWARQRPTDDRPADAPPEARRRSSGAG